jgi:hypothetical protein
MKLYEEVKYVAIVLRSMIKNLMASSCLSGFGVANAVQALEPFQSA